MHRCPGARAGAAGRGAAPGVRRQGVVQVAAGAESAPYLDFRPGNGALLRRLVSTRALGVSRLGGFALGGARGRVAFGASRIPRAAAAAAAAAATVAATVLGGITQQTAQSHWEGRGRAGTHRHAASGLGARGNLTCGRCRRRRRRAPGHLAKWATPRLGPWLGLPYELRVLGVAPRSRSTRPRELGDPARQVSSPWDGGGGA